MHVGIVKSVGKSLQTSLFTKNIRYDLESVIKSNESLSIQPCDQILQIYSNLV